MANGIPGKPPPQPISIISAPGLKLAIAAMLKAVSYTHLDVYKRQVWHNGILKW